MIGLELEQGSGHTRRSRPQWVHRQGGSLIRWQGPRLGRRGWRNILLEGAREKVIQCSLGITLAGALVLSCPPQQTLSTTFSKQGILYTYALIYVTTFL